MTCVRTVKCSIIINGGLGGFFAGERGLRQRDPLSPFLFVLAMEYLSRMLKGMADDRRFAFHPKCHRTKLTHLGFADDLMLFSLEDVSFVTCLQEVLIEFGHTLGYA